jgi:hypothetical protein
MNKVYKKTESVVTREIAGETMLIPISSQLADLQQIFSLDAVSALIWSLLDGTRSFQELIAAVTKEFEVPAEVATADANRFLAELCEAGLVESV